MIVRVAGRTDKGCVRQNNEDAFAVSREAGLLVLCDGTGGHSAGEVASTLAVETVARLLLPDNRRALLAARPAIDGLTGEAAELVAAVRLANQRILADSSSKPERQGMVTTLSALKFGADGIVNLISVGDSRVYRWRAGVLSQLTRDHTYLNELLEDKELSAEEARTFKQKNVLTRALGSAPTAKVDVRVEAPTAGDIYLICSDGLYGPLADEVIARILSSDADDPDRAAADLIDAAKRAGGPDNITVTLAVVSDVQAPPVATLKLEVPDDNPNFAAREKALGGSLRCRAHQESVSRLWPVRRCCFSPPGYRSSFLPVTGPRAGDFREPQC